MGYGGQAREMQFLGVPPLLYLPVVQKLRQAVAALQSTPCIQAPQEGEYSEAFARHHRIPALQRAAICFLLRAGHLVVKAQDADVAPDWTGNQNGIRIPPILQALPRQATTGNHE